MIALMQQLTPIRDHHDDRRWANRLTGILPLWR
ncbi:hypothetical protein ABIC94_003603 [Variovorax paradoxus]|jgi:hypothetical protein